MFSNNYLTLSVMLQIFTIDFQFDILYMVWSSKLIHIMGSFKRILSGFILFQIYIYFYFKDSY
ncbi:hypothetical protein CULT_390046 [[Clostridium] ultunense Esp]|nr:hypothetical protein CULT_390046 [[Clostridium] ultunense Esp]